MKPEEQEAALALLVSRAAWVRQTLAAVQSGTLAKQDLGERFVRRALLYRDESLRQAVRKQLGDVQGATTQQMFAEVSRLAKAIEEADGNPYAGKELFKKNCGKCHRLFDEGGRVGPDLTSYKRDDLRRMLLNVVNPSAEIREGFETYLAVTEDGRTLTGFIEDQDNRVVVLKNAEGQRKVLAKSKLEELAAIPRSVMPDRLLDDYSPAQVRNLFAYLRSTQPLP